MDDLRTYDDDRLDPREEDECRQFNWEKERAEALTRAEFGNLVNFVWDHEPALTQALRAKDAAKLGAMLIEALDCWCCNVADVQMGWLEDGKSPYCHSQLDARMAEFLKTYKGAL